MRSSRWIGSILGFSGTHTHTLTMALTNYRPGTERLRAVALLAGVR